MSHGPCGRGGAAFAGAVVAREVRNISTSIADIIARFIVSLTFVE
jgi:hypothetical protein